MNNKAIFNWGFSSWVVFFAIAGLLVIPYGTVISLVLLFFVSVNYCVRNAKKISLTKTDKLMIFALLFFFLTVIPPFLSEGFRFRYIDLSLRYLLAIPVLVYFIAYRPSGDAIFVGGIVGSILAFFFAIYQYYYLGMPRVDGFLFSINYGYLACSLSFLALFGFLYFSNKWMRALSILGFCMGLYAMALTGTRGAYIAVPVMVATLVALYYKELGFIKVLLGVFLVLILCAVMYTSVPSVQKRMTVMVNELVNYEKAKEGLATTSIGLRLELWVAATEAFKESPVFGLTYPEREALNKKLADASKVVVEVAELPRGHAHSDYFEVLATRGGVGLLSLISLYTIPVFVFLGFFIRGERGGKVGAACGIVFISGFAVFGLSEAPLQANTISAYYALMMAVMYGFVRGGIED